MAPFTSDDLRRRRGADVDARTANRVVAPEGFGEPVRHLVIFAAPVVGFSGPGRGGPAALLPGG
jgi:hypothetical protein